MKRALLALVLGSSLVVTAPACSLFQSPKGDQSSISMIGETVYSGALLALDVVEVKLTEKIEATQNPTDEEIAKFQDMVDRLERARFSLGLAHDYLLDGKGSESDFKTYIFDGASALKSICEELVADGVDIPKPIIDALDIAISFSKSG